MAAVDHNNEICVICGKPGIRSYPLKNCGKCDSLLHRRCIQKPVGQTLLCNNCLPSKAKTSRKSGIADTPPFNIHKVGSSSNRLQSVHSKVTSSINTMRTSLDNAANKNLLVQSNNTHKITRLSTHNTVNKSCKCTENIDNLLDKWEKILQTKLDKQLDIIQKNITENCNNIRSEITSLYSIFKQSNQNEVCLPPTPLQTADEFRMGSEGTKEAAKLSSNNFLANIHNNNSQFFSNSYTKNYLNTDFLSQKNNELNINNNKICSISSTQNTLKPSFLINDILNLTPSMSNKNSRPNILHNDLTNNNNYINSKLSTFFTANTDFCNSSIKNSDGGQW